MSDAPAMPPGEETLHAGADAIAITLMMMAIVFLAAGALAMGSEAYIVAAELHSPRGEPIFWAGVAGLATGVALALIARLR